MYNTGQIAQFVLSITNTGISIEGLMGGKFAGIREKISLPAPLEQTRQYVGALKRIFEDPKRWETVWEWKVTIGSMSELTILSVERFRWRDRP